MDCKKAPQHVHVLLHLANGKVADSERAMRPRQDAQRREERREATGGGIL